MLKCAVTCAINTVNFFTVSLKEQEIIKIILSGAIH